MAGRETRPVAAALASPIAGFYERAKFIVKTTPGFLGRGGGVQLWRAGTCFCVCGLSCKKAATKLSLTLAADA